VEHGTRNPKHQAPKKLQIASSKPKFDRFGSHIGEELGFGAWNFSGAWSLDLELPGGVMPSKTAKSQRIESKNMSRGIYPVHENFPRQFRQSNIYC
jgi:hypothetical protein